ncbi:MAG TPA: hypothetical protein VFK14_00265 [Solirubrobacterales bacterium]|nr:hypothetical protein [Solirubrobacterales bacterium]
MTPSRNRIGPGRAAPRSPYGFFSSTEAPATGLEKEAAMARGPLPNKKKRRTNAATIPTTELPASGRKGRAPNVPTAYELGAAGLAWWKWAWRLPQAMAWDSGALYVIARRASLEDDLAAVDESEKLVERIEDSIIRTIESEDPGDVPERLTYLGLLVGKLKSLGAGRLAILKEMRELDKVLGLTPKGLADLRWEIVADKADEAAEPDPEQPKSGTSKTQDRKARLALVKSG